MAYDDVYSIEYFGTRSVRAWWRRKDETMTAERMLAAAEPRLCLDRREPVRGF